MRRVLIKYEDSISKKIALLNRYCIKEVSTNKGLLLILTEDGYTICKNMLPENIIKSVKVDLYNVLVYANSSRDCRVIIKGLPNYESFIYGRRSESLIDDTYSVNFKGFFTESEFEELKKYNSLSVFKNRNIVRLNCTTGINNFINLQEKLQSDLKNSVYEIFNFETNNIYLRFSICVDINKIDFINKLEYVKIINANVFENYNLN